MRPMTVNEAQGTVLRFPLIFTWTVMEGQQDVKVKQHTLVGCGKR